MEENNNNKPVFSIKSLLGVFLILFAVAGFLGASRGVADNEFAVILTFIFTFPSLYLGGIVGYWLGTILLISIGAVIAIFRKKVKVGSFLLTYLGLLLIFLAATMIASMVVKNQYLNTTSSQFTTYNINTSIKFFHEILYDENGLWTNRSSESLMLPLKAGGGFFGFALSGLLASVGDWLVYIVMSFLILGGLFLVFRKVILGIFKKDNFKKEAPVKEEKQDTPAPTVEEESAPLFLENKEPTVLEPKENKEPEEDLIEKAIKENELKNKEEQIQKEFEYEIKSYNKVHGLTKLTLDEEDEDEIFTPVTNHQEEIETKPALEEAPKTVSTYVEQTRVVVPEDFEEDEEVSSEDIEDEDEEEVAKPITFNLDDKKEVVEEEKELEEVVLEEKPKVELPEVYNYPPLDLLDDTDQDIKELYAINEQSSKLRMEKINNLFNRVKVDAYVKDYVIGPCITRFNVAYGERGLSKHVKAIENDIARVLGGYQVRFEEYVLGSEESGLELPNAERMLVPFKECFAQLPSRTEKNKTMFCLGKDIAGDYVNCNIEKGPHFLVGGTTGSGKSVFINSIITTLIMRNSPKELRLILVDPKRVEMFPYADLPHLLCPIITDPFKAKSALDKLVKEMDMRYDELAKHHVNNIKSYNNLAAVEGFEPMPTIVCFIDEFADLVENCKDAGRPVSLLGGKSRACGIHLVIATQRPTANIISGTIKGNLPCRIALSVKASVDSSVILDEVGAECLLGNGDMLVSVGEVAPNSLVRCQGSFLKDEERDRVVEYIKAQWPTVYDDFYMNLEGEPKDANEMFDEAVENATNNAMGGTISKADAIAMDDELLYQRIVEVVSTRDYISKSFVTTTFNVGFNRAGRIFNRLASEGVISSIPEPGARGFKVIRRYTGTTSSENPGSEELISETYIEDDNEEEN